MKGFAVETFQLKYFVSYTEIYIWQLILWLPLNADLLYS